MQFGGGALLPLNA
ncbi:hypothetical protein D030_4154A, partial [Vibrio parahaemolyticus AQ3810]